MKFSGNDKAAKLAENVRKMEAAVMNDDSDVEGDEREDAEAKAARLGRSLCGSGVEGDDGGNEGGEDALLKRVTRHQSKIAAQDHLFGNGTDARAGAGMKKGMNSAEERGIVVNVAGSGSDKKGKKKAESGSVDAEYIAAKKFGGSKKGYVYTKGPQGVGYYKDGTTKLGSSSKQQQQHAMAANVVPAKNEKKPTSKNGMVLEVEPEVEVTFSQEDLVRRAFAGDDVVAEFAAEKAKDVDAELPSEEVAGALPGWGTWASAKSEPKWAIEAKAKAAAKRAAAAASRKDSGLQYVVISEKWDKKNAKYRTPEVPFPFDSKETYERAMRQPLGKEFNTDASFRNLTRPAIIKDAGVIIQPVRFSASMSEYAREKNGEVGMGVGKRSAVVTVEGGMAKRVKMDKNRGGKKGTRSAT